MSYKMQLPNISTFIFDIDGVLTNGDVQITNNEAIRTLNSRDGFAIRFATKLNYNVFVISGGHSHAVKENLLEMGVQEVYLAVRDKMEIYQQFKTEYQLKDEEILYMGDDIPDYPLIKTAGIGACPNDAAVEVKTIADYISPFNGGRHCVRDVIEQTLRVQKKWFSPES